MKPCMDCGTPLTNRRGNAKRCVLCAKANIRRMWAIRGRGRKKKVALKDNSIFDLFPKPRRNDGHQKNR